MAKSILDIIIKLSKQGGADKETVKGLVQVKSAIMGAAAVAGTFVAAGYTIKKAFDETVGTLINYASQVRRVMDMQNISAEEASKQIQVLDDLKITYEDLEKVVQKNGKTFDFTVNGLAKMSSEYLALTDVQERNAFMQERFGKQWGKWVEVMEKGPDTLREMNGAVDENLVLTEKSILATRRWEMQMDNFNDKVQATKISLGQQLLGILDGSTDEIMRNAQALYKAANGAEFNVNMTKRYTQAQRDAWEEAKKQAEAEWIKKNSLDASGKATDDAAVSAEEYAEKLKAISEAHKDMLGLIGKVFSAEQNYQETSKSLAQERLQLEQERAAALAAGWWEGSEKIREFDAALEENAVKAQENADAHRAALGQIQYDLFITKLSVDGITDAEFLMAQEAGIMFGVFDEESAQSAKNMNDVANAVANGTLKLKDMKRALEMLSRGYTIDVVLRVLSNMITAGDTQQQKYQKRDKTRQEGRTYGGYAAGGISTGPESGHWELLHGTEAVIPLEDGSVPVQMKSPGNMSMAGGGNIYVNLTIASPMTILDQQSAQKTLLPFIVNGIRQAKAQGAIK